MNRSFVEDALCRAFCEALTVTEVPWGLAVGTAFRLDDGDAVGFFISSTGHGMVRLEDDGMTIAELESRGYDMATWQHTIVRAGAKLNEAKMTLEMNVAEKDLSSACLRMTQLLLRMQDA